MAKSIKSSAKEVLELTGRLVDRFGPRIFGSASCTRTAAEIAKELGRQCDHVRKERFSAHPGAYWQIWKIFSAAYIVGLALLIVGGDWIYLSILFFLLELLIFLNYIFYTHLFDPFFPKVEGFNVIGTIEPSGSATQQVIVAGHHDSTYVITFRSRFQKLFVFRVMGVFLFWLVGFCTSLLLSLYRLVYHSEPAYRGVLLIVLLAGLLFIVPFFFYFSRQGSPGAGDNLVACSMGIKIAELFGGERALRPLQRTRVVILSSDGEEPGMLGAEAFVRKHRVELEALKSYVLNFDVIYKACYLSLVTKDRNATIRLSRGMVEECRRIATELGYPIKLGPIPTGGGATDAARFAEAGVEAVSILAMSTALIQEGPGFHTPKDTVDQIEPEAVEACLNIAYRYIQEKDRGG